MQGNRSFVPSKHVQRNHSESYARGLERKSVKRDAQKASRKAWHTRQLIEALEATA